MKLPNLIATTFILSQIFVFPQFANAQLSCQGTVNKVVGQIRSQGVPEVKSNIFRGQANTYNTGNPTNRQDTLEILMASTSGDNSSNVIENILNSEQLMNVWANSIITACGGTAVVNFRLYQTDWEVSYAVQADLKTKVRQCVDDYQGLSWNETFCP
ncbi:MAG: hypothetical protein KME08_12260 [Aphanothece sp. CMT-3BRIN-NPC111]|jgi:hypothetical protein|nr:hypothetical protein [Aphanothece sp. CMT-3BRIN-NPC111]